MTKEEFEQVFTALGLFWPRETVSESRKAAWWLALKPKVAVQSPRGTRKEYKIRARQDRKVADRKSDSRTAPRRLPDKQKRRQTQ